MIELLPPILGLRLVPSYHYKKSEIEASVVSRLTSLSISRSVLNGTPQHRLRILDAGELFRCERASGSIPFDKIVEEWVSGRTIAFDHIYESSENLASISRKLLKDHSLLVHWNAYWSPPRAQGSGRHADEHDVLIVQCHGSKKWRLWSEGAAADVTLRKGDMLSIRAGVEHDPITADESSLHVTVGIRADFDWSKAAEVFARLPPPISEHDSFDCKFFLDDLDQLLGEKAEWFLLYNDLAEDDTKFRFRTWMGKQYSIEKNGWNAFFLRPPVRGKRICFRDNLSNQNKRKILILFLSSGLISSDLERT